MFFIPYAKIHSKKSKNLQTTRNQTPIKFNQKLDIKKAYQNDRLFSK